MLSGKVGRGICLPSGWTFAMCAARGIPCWQRLERRCCVASLFTDPADSPQSLRSQGAFRIAGGDVAEGVDDSGPRWGLDSGVDNFELAIESLRALEELLRRCLGAGSRRGNEKCGCR